MLRSDTVVCGISTTGTGTLTLAACPARPGGVDLFAWLTATGFGFVNGNAIIVSYTLIEYSDTTFSTAVNFEKGIGTVTLGSSLAGTTLVRTTVQSVAGSLNSTGSPTYASPSAVSIGTAANVLVFVGPSAADTPAYGPYWDTTTSGLDNVGVSPVQTAGVGNGVTLVQGSGADYYSIFEWRVPMVVKRCSVYVLIGYSGTSGTPISAAYARIYQINSAGRPGKLLYDFGAFSGTNPLNTSATMISTGASGSGFLLLPGEYFFDFMPTYSGAGGTIVTPKFQPVSNVPKYGRMGTITGEPVQGATATSGTAGAAPDPANLTSYAAINPNGSPLGTCNMFFLAPS
jgi:hypothetical protein